MGLVVDEQGVCRVGDDKVLTVDATAPASLACAASQRFGMFSASGNDDQRLAGEVDESCGLAGGRCSLPELVDVAWTLRAVETLARASLRARGGRLS